MQQFEDIMQRTLLPVKNFDSIDQPISQSLWQSIDQFFDQPMNKFMNQ